MTYIVQSIRGEIVRLCSIGKLRNQFEQASRVFRVFSSVSLASKQSSGRQPRQHNIHLLLSSDTCVYIYIEREREEGREDTNVYVGHYSEWRYLENVGRGRSVEIDVQKDQGLRRESRGRERREKENRAAEGGRGCTEGRKGEAYHVSRNELPAPQGVQLLHVHPSLPPCSSPRLVSSPPPCPRKHPRTFFSPKSFCFLRRRGMRGLVYPTRLDSSMVVPTYLGSFTDPRETFSNLNRILFSSYDSSNIRFDTLSIPGETWRKNRFIIWTNALLKYANWERKIIIG